MIRNTGFKYCPRCACQDIHEKDGKAMVCSGCGFEYYQNPVAAVGCIIETERGVLVTKRARNPCKDLLDLPGGFADFGETLEQALRREIDEELGLKLEEVKYFASFPNTYDYASVRYHTLDCIFCAKCHDLSRLRIDSEIASVEYVNAKSFQPERIGFDSIRRAIEAYFAQANR